MNIHTLTKTHTHIERSDQGPWKHTYTLCVYSVSCMNIHTLTKIAKMHTKPHSLNFKKWLANMATRRELLVAKSN